MGNEQVKRRALLIAIGDYQQKGIGKLQAPLSDTQNFEKLLVERFAFKPDEEIIRLADKEATTPNIVETIQRKMIDVLDAGDVAVIYYSGHGAQTPDLDGDESDGRDEAFVTFDAAVNDPKTWLTDDVVGQLNSRFKTENVLFVLDNCHSGTGTRASDDGTAETLADGLVVRSADIYFSAPPEWTPELVGREMKTSGERIELAACSPEEAALEAMPPLLPTPQGLFTGEITRQLAALDDSTTFAQLMGKVGPAVNDTAKTLSQNKKSQTPQIHGTRSDIGVNDFFLGKTKPTAAGADPAHGANAAPTSAPAPDSPSGSGSPANAENPTPQTEATPANTASQPTPAIAPGWQPGGKIKVQGKTDKPSYKFGDLMTITATADQDCYLRLYLYNASQEISQLYPNTYQQEHFVKAGQTVVIGGLSFPFDFKVQAPAGNELIKVVASKRPFTDEESRRFSEQVFNDIQGDTIASLSSRGITPEAKANPNEFGEAILIYSVTEQ